MWSFNFRLVDEKDTVSKDFINEELRGKLEHQNIRMVDKNSLKSVHGMEQQCPGQLQHPRAKGGSVL